MEKNSREFMALLEAVPEALLVADGKGEIRNANARAEQLFGYPNGQILREPIERLLPHGRSKTDHMLGVRADGSEFPVEVNLSSLVLSGEKLTLAEIRDSGARRLVEERLASLLDATPDAIVITDEQGTIVLVNNEAEKLFDVGRHEMIGRNVGLLMPELFHPSHPKRRKMHEGGVVVRALRRNGEEIPIEVNVNPLDTPEGRLSITAIRDVSERQRLEQERFNLSQAQEAIRMRDEFLSIVSHELKTPLTVLAMQSESIEIAAEKGASSGVPDRIVFKAKTIRKASKRLELLVNQLLDLSRITAGRLELYPEQVNLSELVTSIAEHFEEVGRQVGSSIHVVAEEPIWGCWDPLRTEQIVTNLISNAIKYGGGKPIEVSVSKGEESARVVVRDHGIGIDPRHQKRIFERFERLVSERNYGGFGLGLWIVRQVIEAQGGKIDVWSRPGEGSAFTVELPRKLECVARTMPPNLDLRT